MGVHHDAEDMVSGDIMQLPRLGKAFVSPNSLGGSPAAMLQEAQDDPRAEAGRPALDAQVEVSGGPVVLASSRVHRDTNATAE